ncbi:Arm DNA-binding domain-containing protein [Methylocystis sp. IM4]|uniref:tyrosine-type recombinase/integrase n=2 Tax=unclassified Methylocystis TaxID=2625913 RepID=UPI00311A6643
MGKLGDWMAYQRLTAAKVRTAGPGVYPDGLGLYLCVSDSGSKSWIYRFSWQGRRPEMGLGSLIDVSLADAREAALEARRQVKAGINPIDAKRASKSAGVAGKTFGDAADAFFAAKQSEYSNAKYREMTRLALTRTVAAIRPLPVDRVDTEAVLSVLRPLWLETPKTARRVREKIEAVLDYASVHKLREGDNPARWRGHLEHLLPRHDKRANGHHAALPYKDAPGFFAQLGGVEGVAPRALEFTILTAARTGKPSEHNGRSSISTKSCG